MEFSTLWPICLHLHFGQIDFPETDELIIPDECFTHDRLSPLLDGISDKLLQNKVKEYPGSEGTEMGKI